MPKLSPKQARFVEEYLIDLNATQAAIRAGYSAKTATVIGAQNLTKLNVAEAIEKAKAKRSERAGLTSDMVIDELRKIGFANMADYMKAGPGGDPYLDFSALTRDQTAALHEVTVEDYVDGRGDDARAVKRTKFKLYDKRAALVDLGRHLGLFEIKHRIAGKIEQVRRSINVTPQGPFAPPRPPTVEERMAARDRLFKARYPRLGPPQKPFIHIPGLHNPSCAASCREAPH
jgi:phage terminase small subunit